MSLTKRTDAVYVIIIILTLFCSEFQVFAHSYNGHKREIYSVLPFHGNKVIDEWIRFGSSKIIDDGSDFQQELRQSFGVTINKGDHRMLFHWPYNSIPWNSALDSYIKRYSWSENSDSLSLFKETIKNEQKRRNDLLNKKTAETFGFSDSGKEGQWSNAFSAILYDVHLLGDWVPLDDVDKNLPYEKGKEKENKNFKGLSPVKTIAEDLAKHIRVLDSDHSGDIYKDIRYIGKMQKGDQEKAAILLWYLQHELPLFISTAENGYFLRRFAGHWGRSYEDLYKFTDVSSQKSFIRKDLRKSNENPSKVYRYESHAINPVKINSRD